jgi:hypothetical protein
MTIPEIWENLYDLPSFKQLADTLGGMCRKVQCQKCQLTTWAGCGAHVEQVLAGVPQSQRCQGHADENSSAALGGVRSWFLRLLSR